MIGLVSKFNNNPNNNVVTANILRSIAKKIFLLSLWPYEHIFKNRIKYVYLKRKSNVLAIVFSGLDTYDNKRVYNYIKGLRNIPADFLFLSDPFGFRGSYYWKESGYLDPFKLTQELIKHIIGKGRYDTIVTLGTSKGGSAAIIHGIQINATIILAGACQFKIGSFLKDFPEVFEGMTGRKPEKENILSLDEEFQDLIRKITKRTQLILLYSTKEPTYYNHTIHLLDFLKKNAIPYQEIIRDFELHGETGAYFKPVARMLLLSIVNKTTPNFN